MHCSILVPTVTKLLVNRFSLLEILPQRRVVDGLQVSIIEFETKHPNILVAVGRYPKSRSDNDGTDGTLL